MNIIKLKEQVKHVERMIFVYGNELCDEVRLSELQAQLDYLNAAILEIMNNDTSIQ
jgi:hypothetical protein